MRSGGDRSSVRSVEALCRLLGLAVISMTTQTGVPPVRQQRPRSTREGGGSLRQLEVKGGSSRVENWIETTVYSAVLQ